jgi:hypothetical protein
VADGAIGVVQATTLDPGTFFPVATGALESLQDLAIRVRGRLAFLAERVGAEEKPKA